MGRPPENDFRESTKKELAKCVGYLCSSPHCRVLTIGPSKLEGKSLNVGVAAHITAAAEGGPRWDGSLSPEERRAYKNGIWLCAKCASLIDRDPDFYTVLRLDGWKRDAENYANARVNGAIDRPNPRKDDLELLSFYRVCFNRRVFIDRFEQERSIEAFDKAIEDTIIAINTGRLRDRGGGELREIKGEMYLQRDEWRHQLEEIVRLLMIIHDRYKVGRASGEIHHAPIEDAEGRITYCINNGTLARWFDDARGEVMSKVSALLQSGGLAPLRNHYL